MHRLGDGGWLLDTPGMRELQLFDVQDALQGVFAELPNWPLPALQRLHARVNPAVPCAQPSMMAARPGSPEAAEEAAIGKLPAQRKPCRAARPRSLARSAVQNH
jgi:hypothetical protein